MSRSALVVAVDGPSGSGKSTVSRAVARRLALRYLDTGSMYRALTWLVLRDGFDPADAEAVTALAESVRFAVGTDPACPSVMVNEESADAHIRGRQVTGNVSAVSAHPAVRSRLVARQRELIGAGGIVVEGRDIGTVVAPDAPVKIFLTASDQARAQRRGRDPAYTDGPPADDPAAGVSAVGTLGARNGGGDVAAELARRDRLDSGRAASPLLRAPDAHELDSTALSPQQVVEVVVGLATAALAAAGHR